MRPTRRQLLKWGAGFGALAGAGALGRALWVPPPPSKNLASVPELAARLYDAMSEAQRAQACVAYDHPLRQYHNRGVTTGGIWGFRLGRDAMAALVDIVHAGLSEAGRGRILEQFFFRWLGFPLTQVLVCGNPHDPPFQVIVSGAHLNLRLGGRNREGVAFGGPQVWGDQRGDGEIGLPGNVYRFQLEVGQRLVSSLTPGERERVRQPKAPPQTAIELQGSGGSFAGVAVADLVAASRGLAHDMVASILGTYAEADSAYAWECIERNGGVDALHLADYDRDHQPGRRAGDGPSQIIRLEGPAAVFHYRGEPHLHAFLNVALDGDAPLSVGELIAENPAPLDSAGVKALFEDVMLAATSADVAYYPLESVATPLRAGPIRSGDLYNLESWRENVVVAEVEGARLAPPIVQALEARGDAVRARSVYRVATIGYVADRLADETLGAVESTSEGPPLRDATIAHLKRHGFDSRG